jgi:hypothetical protein
MISLAPQELNAGASVPKSTKQSANGRGRDEEKYERKRIECGKKGKEN